MIYRIWDSIEKKYEVFLDFALKQDGTLEYCPDYDFEEADITRYSIEFGIMRENNKYYENDIFINFIGKPDVVDLVSLIREKDMVDVKIIGTIHDKEFQYLQGE